MPAPFTSFYGRHCLPSLCFRAFSQTEFTEDLKKISMPTLLMHGDDDQIVPYAGSAPLAAELLPNGTLKTYKGFLHSMSTTEAGTITPICWHSSTPSTSASLFCGAHLSGCRRLWLFIFALPAAAWCYLTVSKALYPQCSLVQPAWMPVIPGLKFMRRQRLAE
jgi:fermentation-respiration switch protein FrsA (DUF1100 family)